MLLARESHGGRREMDDGAVSVLTGRQREEGVGHRLSQLRPLLQALLPEILPAFVPQPQILSGCCKRAQRYASSRWCGGGEPGGAGGSGEVVRRIVRHEVAEVHLTAGGSGG